MAKKIFNSGKKASKTPAKKSESPAVSRTEVRNSPIPKVSAPAAPKTVITREMIAKRAFEIWADGSGGSETENWARAERELMSGK
jgi:hypothetical protein